MAERLELGEGGDGGAAEGAASELVVVYEPLLNRLPAGTPMYGLERVEGGADTVFEAHPAVVVRPDRYLFGVVDEAWPLDRLMRRLGERVGLR